MSRGFEKRLAESVADTPLAEALPAAAQPLLEHLGESEACARIEGRVLRGMARMIVGNPQIAGFLGRRPELIERMAKANGATLPARAHEFNTMSSDRSTGDLENDLDALRVLRHEETCLTACLDLGGVVRFEEVSYFLSVLAETITRRALHLAQQSDKSGAAADFAVIGMGKVAGREFTYHSDLDLIFLYGGPAEMMAETSRIGTRLISYLGTMTGAGIAYEVDTRLRPSGRQGVLVTSFSGYERYQIETAETWEHMAQMRARAIAGNVDAAQSVLDRVREGVLAQISKPWEYIADLRGRVEQERTRHGENSLSLKTGPGGLMDVDFLASGGLLEMQSQWFPPLPSVPAMLKTVTQGGRIGRMLLDYRFLRLVESRARWIAGRGVDEIRTERKSLAVLAELVQPHLGPAELLELLTEAQTRIRAAFEAVVEAGTIAVLAET